MERQRSLSERKDCKYAHPREQKGKGAGKPQGGQGGKGDGGAAKNKRDILCKWVKQGKTCPDGPKCEYKHTPPAGAAAPQRTDKAKLCNFIKDPTKGVCPFGSNCKFSHSPWKFDGNGNPKKGKSRKGKGRGKNKGK